MFRLYYDSHYHVVRLKIVRHDDGCLSTAVTCSFLDLPQGKCQGNTSQDGARPPLFQNCCVVLCIVCFVSFCVLFVCKCVLHRVTTQLQLTNVSYISKNLRIHGLYHILIRVPKTNISQNFSEDKIKYSRIMH